MVAHNTVRDVLLPDFVGASESDTVYDSAALLLAEATDYLVVVRGTEPVGLVGVRDLLDVLVNGEDETRPLASVMRTEFETVSPDTPVDDALTRFVGTEDPLLVVEDDELFGVLTERDLVSALTSAEELPARDQLERPTVNDTEAGRLQGICEDCGAFTQSLSNADGRSICVDCAES
ncbi:CBS domain-containing protein [Halocatena halophila]|uniref:CBS domain-containing protein n=1 Tax=Halocatena halophila TaxID=2814576 RepID=UPI002ED38E3D